MNKFIANITIEAKTPLKVGSKAIDFLQDSPVQKDWNDLPMILGTSLAGVLRKEFKKEFSEEKVDDIFGYESKQSNKDEDREKIKGSRLIISNALLCDEDGEVCEGLLTQKSDFLQNFSSLPKRDHTAITSKGVALEHSKFDEEVVYKGSRFKFNLELLVDNGIKEDDFKNILNILYKNSFRVGGGSTKGFGKIEVINIKYDEFDNNSDKYKNFTNSLNITLSKPFKAENIEDKEYRVYKITLTPDDFYMFGGWYDSEADNSSVYEKIILHEDSVSKISKRKILIPASSIKGAISHRTTFYYNLLNKKFVGDDAFENVEAIFGTKKDNDKNGNKGKVIFSDIFLNDDEKTKIFDHVSIDRFTGGAIEGALFQEKTISSKQELKFEILLDKKVEDKALEAFEKALDDLCIGMLPLGGATTKGHGVFTGKWSKK